MDEIKELLSAASRSVEAELASIIPPETAVPAKLHQAIHWSLFAGGKRVRPAVVLLTGRGFGAVEGQLMRTAAAVEMIHTYSLIHDDLPSMDDDDLRRGRAACHVKFGEATAILAGDVLQTLAFGCIADDVSLTAEIRVRLISLLASAAGTPNGMVAGQQLDIDGEGSLLLAEDIENIHARKTGALITAAAVSGAMIGGASVDEIDAVRRYGNDLGLLFQITDDLLDVTGKTAELGKTSGKDAASEKATYPAIYGVEKTREMADKTCQAAIAALSGTRRNLKPLADLAAMVARRAS